MRSFATVFSRGCAHLALLISGLVIILIALLVGTVLIQVFGRLLLANSPLWTVDYATLFLVWSTFLGASVTLRKQEHFRIDIGIGHTGWRRITDVASHLAVIVILVFLMVAGIEFTATSTDRFTGMTEVSMAYYMASVPVGAALMLLFAFERVVLVFAKQEAADHPDERSGDGHAL